MIHQLAKEYGWSKNQIDEIYPEEAIVLLRFLGYEKKDETIREKMDYYSSLVDKIYIQYGDPEITRNNFVKAIEKIQGLSINVISIADNDLPDHKTINRLKNFIKDNKK